MTKTIENLFKYLHHLSNLVVLLTFFFSVYKAKKEKGLAAIVIYCFADLLMNSVPYFRPSRPVFYMVGAFFTFAEYSLFTFFIWANLNSKKAKNLILLASLVFFLVITYYNIRTSFHNIDSVPIGAETILILVFSFYYLYEQMSNTNNLFIYTQYQFWIIVGFLIYLAGSFFVYIYASQIDHDLLTQYWFLTNVFYVLMTSFFTVGILVSKKKIKKPILSTPYLN